MIEQWVRSIGLHGFIDILTLETHQIQSKVSSFELWDLLIRPQIVVLKYDSNCALRMIVQNVIHQQIWSI